jgi:hypothetical protein
VSFVKYPDLPTKEELTGNAGNAHREGATIHSIWQTDRHEIVHLLAGSWGDPPALLAEGLAVHLSGSWQGQPVRAFAQGLTQGGRWIAPSAMLSSAAFRALPDLDTYAVAGAFVGWVVARHGKATLRALYRRLQNGAPPEENRRALEEILGRSSSGIDDQVRAWAGRATGSAQFQ